MPSAKIDTASSGQNTIVAAVSGKAIRVTSYSLVVAGTVAPKWRSNTTDLSGAMPFVANGGISTAYNPDGHVVTAVGEALILNLDQAIQVSGHVTYHPIGN